MCVIIHALEKQYLKLHEVRAAMDRNPDGFFMCHWAAGSKNMDDRISLRTLDREEALRFFEEIPDTDEFVMHARIPSQGTKTIDNVHGWEEEGVMFCHNMTITCLKELIELDKWKGTDSEYFFKVFFIPLYRDAHTVNPNLKPSELGASASRLAALMCGSTNKFCFIMPDNTVVRMGKWVALHKGVTTCTEEREVEEVVGEMIDVEGKSTKKMGKVKKNISVEREFPTVVASNDYFVTSSYGAYGNGYGAYGSKTAPVPATGTSTYPAAASAAGTKQNFKVGFGDEEDYDDYGEWAGAGSSNGYTPAVSAATVASQAAKSKKKAKKGEATDEEVSMFLEWRDSIELPGARSKPAFDDKYPERSTLFDGVSVSDGEIGIEDFRAVFGFIVRCIVYNNIKTHASDVIEASGVDVGTAVLTEANLDYEEILGKLIPKEFDEKVSEFLCSRLSDLQYEMEPDVEKRIFTLPSEVVMQFVRDAMDEFDSIACDGGVAGTDAGAGLEGDYATDSPVEKLAARCIALDRFLNVSVDDNGRGCKDVEKFIKAAVLNGRKLKWLTPGMILEGDQTMTDIQFCWRKSKEQEAYLAGLNMLAEACVTGLDSLTAADRRYVAEIRDMGFDFSKKGSMDIVSEEDEGGEGQNDAGEEAGGKEEK